MPLHHHSHRPWGPLAALLCTLAVPVPAAAPARVAWTLTAADDRPSVAPGSRLDVRARAAVEPGWYIYAMSQPPGGPTALRISVSEGQPFTAAGPVAGPAPKRAWDAAFEIESAKHDGTVTFTLPVRLDAGAAAGQAVLKLQVRYQACSDTLCLRPTTETLSLPVEVRGTGRPSQESPRARKP